MSVSKYSMAELSQLYADIRNVKSVLPFCAIKDEEVLQALHSAYIANRAAITCTYNEAVKLEKFELADEHTLQASIKEVYRKIGLLLYNCVSNGGRDFMPEKDRLVLEKVQHAIAWHLVDVPDKPGEGEEACAEASLALR